MLAGLQPANERIVALWLNASCKVSTPTEKHRVAVACALQGRYCACQRQQQQQRRTRHICSSSDTL